MTATARVTMTISMDIYPRAGQPLEEATAHFRKVFQEYMTLKDAPFWEDYGGTLAEIKEFQENEGEEPCWGGYDGPFVTHVSVRDEDAVFARAQSLADPRDEGAIDPCMWPSALAQAQQEWENERETYYPDA